MASLLKVKISHFWIFCFCICVLSGNSTIKSTSFTREDSCRLQDRIDDGCAEQKQGVFKSLLSCASVCQEDCLGFVKGDNNTCYTYKSCGTSISCSHNDELFKIYKEVHVCQNGGVLNSTTNKCKCVDNWVGDSCERHPKSCRELFLYGYLFREPDSSPPPGSIRLVDLHLDNYHVPIRALCQLHRNYQETQIFANSGLNPSFFHRPWSSFLNGFTSNDVDTWLGLEKIKALNDAGLDTLSVHLLCMDHSGPPATHLRKYNNVRFGNESSGYSFTFTGTTPSDISDYGDCLGSLKGAKFSTFDKDNDQDPNTNCAAQNEMAWWYKDCDMPCKPLAGRFIPVVGLDYSIIEVSMWLEDW